MKNPPSNIKKILVISLSNIGDVILTFPVIDVLLRDFPQAKLAVVIGPKAAALFEKNPRIDQVHIFDKKKQSFRTLQWIYVLRRERFDLTVDLRHTAIPFMIGARWRTPVFFRQKQSAVHMKEKHLNCLRSVYAFNPARPQAKTLFISEEDQKYVDQFIRDEIGGKDFVLLGPGAASQLKRWPEDSFTELANEIAQRDKLNIVFIGNQADKSGAERIARKRTFPSVNVCGRMNLTQLAGLMKRAKMLIVNDSGPMHLASYLNVPAIAIFVSTDPNLYGPWGEKGIFIKNPQVQEILNLFRLHQGEVVFGDHETIP